MSGLSNIPSFFLLCLVCCWLTFGYHRWPTCSQSLQSSSRSVEQRSTTNPWHDVSSAFISPAMLYWMEVIDPCRQVVPSKSLDYHDCYDGLQCARLELPMSWMSEQGEDAAIVSIAVLRRPAKVNVTDPRYGGAILVNPGNAQFLNSYMVRRHSHIHYQVVLLGPVFFITCTTGQRYRTLSIQPKTMEMVCFSILSDLTLGASDIQRRS